MNPLANQVCRVDLLGGLQVRQGERFLTRFSTYKTGALLAYLAYFRTQRHPRELLIGLFWPDNTPERGRNNLSIALSSLRHQLESPGVAPGTVLTADRLSVGLNSQAVHTDVAEFETYLQRAGNAHSETERAQLLADAVPLYRGELLRGHYEDWLLPERQRLLEAYVQALRRLVRHFARQREYARALDYAHQAVTADPLREEAYRDLMRLYVAARQPSAAVQQYRELEQTLRVALGVKPSAATRQLLREIEAREQQATEAKQRQPEKTGGSPPAAFPAAQRSEAPAALPTGTVTFLMTDIASSTAQWEREGDHYKAAQLAHHTLLRQQFQKHNGYEVKDLGDGFLVAFERPADALSCAIACQSVLAAQEGFPSPGALRARMALHTGEAEPEGGDYHGLAINRTSRLLVAAHGGQILCSETTACLLRRDLPSGVRLKDLGVYRLRDLALPERLFQVEWPQMPQREFPAPNAEAGYTANLPLAFTRFFGREEDLMRLREMLVEADTRLVTVTGPGGTGKTRLALEVAQRLVEPFMGAVWFVPLGDLGDASLIAGVVAEAMRLPHVPDLEPLEQVVEALSRQASLLILDNFEQLVERGIALVQTLLERVPTLTLLLTSRQQLNLSCERVFALRPLPTPNGTDTPEHLSMYDSVRLFVDRAQAVRPDFQVTGHNAAAMAGLCDSLEGIPLAIELAAARAQVMTPAQMLAQLQNRFEFLVSRKRDATERHRTLRAAMEWSLRLLSPELQTFFARLSVFQGGWTAEAAETVCEEPLALDNLAQLRECSLVLAEESQEEMRFRMLETLREYAESQLAEAERTAGQHRHAGYYLALAEAAEPKLRGPEQRRWLARLEAEQANLRATLHYLMEANDPDAREQALRLAGALGKFWFIRGQSTEGREWLRRVLSLAALEPGTYRADGLTSESETARRIAKARFIAGQLARSQGDYEAAQRLCRQSLETARQHGDKQGIASALDDLGLVADFQGNYGIACALYEESLAMNREIGDRAGTASALNHLGLTASHQGDSAAARSFYEESLTILREIGDRGGISGLLNNLGLVAAEQGDYIAARAYLEESLAMKREMGDRTDIAGPLGNLGVLARNRGEYAAARAYLEESLILTREIGDRPGIAGSLNNLGLVAYQQGDYAQAQSLFQESLTIAREIGDCYSTAWSLHALGDIARDQGDDALARACYEEETAIRRESGEQAA